MLYRVVFLLVFVVAFPAQAQTVLKLSVAQGPAFPLGRAGERWAQLLSEKAGGAFQVQAFPGAVLAARDPLREFGALRDGAADLAVGGALAWFAQLPAFGAYVLPWLAADTAEQEALASDGTLRERVSAAVAQAGVIVVATAPLGERVLATMKSAVQAPGDMTGLRLRAVTSPLILETLGVLGARAQAMSLGDAQAAFASGALDGQEGPASTLAATRITATGQRFVTRWGAFADVMVFAVRRTVWDAWSAEQRAAAQAAAQEAARDAGALAREDAALSELTKQGATIVRLAPAQRAAFRAAVAPVWAKWTQPIGPDLVSAAEAAVARASAPK
jgi:TRAP-type C4-dicarboxylate transport system substrate-binding protein